MLLKAGVYVWGRCAALIPILSTSLAVLLPGSAPAFTSVNLRWTASPVTNITSYTVYYGAASRAYTNSIAVGNVTNIIVTDLTDGVTYYFASTATDSWGIESDYSSEAVLPGSAPTITAIADQSTSQDTPTPPILFTVGGCLTDPSQLTVYANSSRTDLVPTNNIVFGGSGSNRSVTITPASGQSGEANISITVRDGAVTASTAFVLTVAAQRPPPPNSAPTISTIGNLTMTQDSPTPPIPFTIADPQQPAATLTLWAASTNCTLLPTNSILLAGSNGNRTITLIPASGHTGDCDVVLYVSDGTAISSAAFHVTVRPKGPQSGLTLLVAGKGKVSPDLTTQKLSTGRQYVISASPSPGQMFCGWGGSITSLVQSLSFVMKSNLVLQANFAPLNLRSSGAGTFSPDLRTAQNLVVGKSYTVTALPGAGQLFMGWTGTITSSSPRITFVMATNVNLQANFIPNPWLAAQGTYNGLFYEEAAVRPNSAGAFSLSVGSMGSYSGALQLGAKRLPVSGQLDLQCQDARVLALSPTNSLTLSLRFGMGAQADKVSGTLTASTWVSALSGDRAVFDARRPAPYAGAYTLILPGSDGDPSLPAGDGYGTVRVTTAGIASFTGTLADGTAVSQSATVSKGGFWPLYIPVYSGQGVLISWLAFTNLPGSDINGLVSWVKPAISNAQYYPAGFTQECDAVGSSYIQPARQYTLALTLTNAHLAFSGGNLPAAFTNSVAVDRAGKLTYPSSNALTLTVTPLSGTFKGRVTDPSSGNSFSFGGAVFQKQNTGYGSLMGTNQSGGVTLSR
jgi:hypothetical protein